MAWYLSQVVTDPSPMRGLLDIYEKVGAVPYEEYTEKLYGKVIPFLRESELNTDHIDGDNIPSQYHENEYQWYAEDFHRVLNTINIIQEVRLEDEEMLQYAPSELSLAYLSNKMEVTELLQRGMKRWINDKENHPYNDVKKICHYLKQDDIYPCSGLMLLEFMMLLKWIDKHVVYDYLIDNAYEYIRKLRFEFYPHMNGERDRDIIDYSHFLWNNLKNDINNYRDANMYARASLMLMMQAGELVFGQVPNNLYGFVQYVTLAKEYKHEFDWL